MGLERKTNFYLVKRWFGAKNQLLPLKKMVLETKTNFYLVKRWFWSQKPTFASQKDGFPEADQAKTIFLRGKSWFFYAKPSFYEAKPKKPIFFETPSPFSKKDGFFGFLVLPRKRWFFHRKTNFSLVKRWFRLGVLQENHLFTREKLVFL